MWEQVANLSVHITYAAALRQRLQCPANDPC